MDPDGRGDRGGQASDEDDTEELQLDGEKRAELEARAKRLEQAFGGADARGTMKLSREDAAQAGGQPATPFSQPSEGHQPPPLVEPSVEAAALQGATVNLSGAAAPVGATTTPFRRITEPAESPPPAPAPAPATPAPAAPAPAVVAPEPPRGDRSPWAVDTGRGSTPAPAPRPPPTPEPVSVPLAVPEQPTEATPPAEEPEPEIEVPDALDEPDRYSTPEARLQARTLSMLMTTENEDLSRFVARHVASESTLAHSDVVRVRDILRALSYAFETGSEDTCTRIEEAWQRVYEEPRQIRKRLLAAKKRRGQ